MILCPKCGRIACISAIASYAWCACGKVVFRPLHESYPHLIKKPVVR